MRQAALPLMVLAIALIVAIYLSLQSRGPGRDPAAELYRRFCRRCAGVGLARDPAEGPLAFASRVRRTRPDLAAAATTITERYIAARYGGD